MPSNGEAEENGSEEPKENFVDKLNSNNNNARSNDELTINEAISEIENFENEEKRKLEKSQISTNTEVEIESALLELIVKLSNKNLIYELDLTEETLNTINKFKAD